MCGIAGLWCKSQNCHQFRDQWLIAALHALSHRGPDHQGTWKDPTEANIVLGHRRLAVIDLTDSGNQPMVSEDGQVVITFNGEIYNFRELRKDLEAFGMAFHSLSDTEVIIKGYQRWGVGVLDRLVGMFAFALWDAKQQQLFLARDRIGEKPLYYAHTDQGFAFASEIQALAKLPWVDCRWDQEALALYLGLQYIPAPYSIYRGISKLPPAHAMIVRQGKTEVWRYWDPVALATGPRLSMDTREAAQQLEILLRQAVAGQMIADVPLGAFLSGGIDSSTVVSFMAELSARPVKTFTIGFHMAGYDEVEHAAAVARHLHTEHTVEYLSEKDVLGLVSEVVQIYGEPFADSSALPTYLVARTARQHVTVSLSGDGGDEAFGGYTRYTWLERAYPWLNLAKPFGRLIAPVLKRLPLQQARAAPLIGKPPKDVYLGKVGIFQPEEVWSLTGRSPALFEYERAWGAIPKPPLRRQAMLADLLTYLPDAILAKVDRAAMAVSLETRAPLLDHRLLEFSLQLPVSLVENRSLLKQVLFRRVPKSLLNRPKQGFDMPLARWLRGELRDLVLETLTAQKLESMGLQNVQIVAQMLSEHLGGVRSHTARLWSLLVLSLWSVRQGR
jgi:asparagine synthase (glutamine-hydrolysing)